MIMNNTFPWPHYSSKEINIVKSVIQSGKVNYLFGEQGRIFESNFSKFSNTKYSLALANGTLALDLCLRSIGLQEGDEVLVTSRSFVASASCISLLGGIPVFCDVDLNSQNISIEEIKKKFSRKTKAIICVHFAGFPCDMNELTEFASKKGIFIVEDCAQAHGAKIGNKSVGSFGDISAWSFCNDKIMTLMGEGGMVTTNSSNLHKFIASFNNHGKNLKKYFDKKPHTKFPYLHDGIGSNYRLTEMQSAVGVFQLSMMEKWNEQRSKNALHLEKAVRDLEIVSLPMLPENFKHGWYKYYMTLNPKKIKKSLKRIDILNKLRAENVPAFFGGCGEIYNEKSFKKFKPSPLLHNAKFLENYSLMFEVHPTITTKEIKRRSLVIRKILKDSCLS